MLFYAEIIIDRFHIIQMAGRLLDNARIQLLKQIKDHRCREYKVLKSQWRLFHKDDDQLESAKPVFLRGINEFMTQQDAVDLILRKYPDFERVYETYQELQSALKQRDVDKLNSAIFAYENAKTAMDQTFTPPIISPTVPNTTTPMGHWKASIERSKT